MNFLQSIEICFKKYVQFDGRASRSEYWWFYLFIIICWIVAFMLGPVIEGLVILGLTIPYLSVACRRLHDINKSGWLQLIGLIPFVGWIFMIVWCATDGDKRNNRFGKTIYKIKKRRR